MIQKIKRVFINVHMGLAHDGLNELLKTHKCGAPENAGEHVVFINRTRNRVKMLSHKQVIHYLRLPAGECLRMETVEFFPACFTPGRGIDYSAALAKSFARYLKSERKKTDGEAML